MNLIEKIKGYFAKQGAPAETGSVIASSFPSEVSPVFSKKRHPCPFYGFHMAAGVLMDQKGNQCALKMNSYSPCHMEIYQRETPDWDACSFNREENRVAIENIIESCRIYPDEFFPKGKSSWTGMPLKVWADYVMSQKRV